MAGPQDIASTMQSWSRRVDERRYAIDAVRTCNANMHSLLEVRRVMRLRARKEELDSVLRKRGFSF